MSGSFWAKHCGHGISGNKYLVHTPKFLCQCGEFFTLPTPTTQLIFYVEPLCLELYQSLDHNPSYCRIDRTGEILSGPCLTVFQCFSIPCPYPLFVGPKIRPVSLCLRERPRGDFISSLNCLQLGGSSISTVYDRPACFIQALIFFPAVQSTGATHWRHVASFHFMPHSRNPYLDLVTVRAFCNSRIKRQKSSFFP